MVDILGVRRSEKRVKGMGEALNDRVKTVFAVYLDLVFLHWEIILK